MSDNPTFYWDIVSPPCRSVKALMDIGKVPCKYIYVNISVGQTSKPQFLKLNPIGKIPFLIHNNLQISESDAILKYLCQKYKGIPESYYGKTPQQRGQVNQYILWYHSKLRPRMFKYVLMAKGSLLTGKPLYQNQIDEFHKELDQILVQLNSLLVEKNYIANNTPTIADLLYFFQVSGVIFYDKDTSTFPEIDRWFKNIYKIPEVKALTHQWFPMAKQMQKVFKQIEVIKSKL